MGCVISHPDHHRSPTSPSPPPDASPELLHAVHRLYHPNAPASPHRVGLRARFRKRLPSLAHSAPPAVPAVSASSSPHPHPLVPAKPPSVSSVAATSSDSSRVSLVDLECGLDIEPKSKPKSKLTLPSDDLIKHNNKPGGDDDDGDDDMPLRSKPDGPAAGLPQSVLERAALLDELERNTGFLPDPVDVPARPKVWKSDLICARVRALERSMSDDVDRLV